jgi:hypothetical protein
MPLGRVIKELRENGQFYARPLEVPLLMSHFPVTEALEQTYLSIKQHAITFQKISIFADMLHYYHNVVTSKGIFKTSQN